MFECLVKLQEIRIDLIFVSHASFKASVAVLDAEHPMEIKSRTMDLSQELNAVTGYCRISLAVLGQPRSQPSAANDSGVNIMGDGRERDGRGTDGAGLSSLSKYEMAL
jgi:hypothetical protein